MTSRLRQGSALILIHIGASTATGVTVIPGSAVATVKQGFTQRDRGRPASNGDWCSTSNIGGSCPATRVLL
jgi:hypothetical protein